jgi:hypothetical protein
MADKAIKIIKTIDRIKYSDQASHNEEDEYDE